MKELKELLKGKSAEDIFGIFSDMLTIYWEENGFNEDETANFLTAFEEGMDDQAVSISIMVRYDENDYEE